MDGAIVLHTGDGYIAPVTDVLSARVRYQAVKEFVDSIMRVEVDYGIIPGTNKPTLLKPGAEKLSSFFALSPTFEIVEKELDWTGREHDGEPFFYFHYRCRLMRGSFLAAEGEGSANSFEKKYRYRSGERVCPNCQKPTIIKGKEEYGGGWICFAKKGGCGAKFKTGDQSIEGQQVGQVKNPDISDVVNTLQKMAQKRAFVAAVLLAVNGSEYFTQDVEDFIDGSYQIEQPHRQPETVEPPAPVEQAQAEPPAPTHTGATTKNGKRLLIKIQDRSWPKDWIDKIKDATGANPYHIGPVLEMIGATDEWNDDAAIGAATVYLTARNESKDQETALAEASAYLSGVDETA